MRNPQWQSTATFVSFRNSQPQRGAETNQPSDDVSQSTSGGQARDTDGPVSRTPTERLLRNRKPAHRLQGAGVQEHNQEGETQEDIFGYGLDQARGSRPVGRYSRSVGLHDATGNNEASVLDRRVEPVAERNTELVVERTSEPIVKRNQRPAVHKKPSPAEDIDRQLKSRQAKVAWETFERTYSSRNVPALIDPSFNDITFLTGGKIFERLYSAVASEFTSGNNEVPRPTTVLFRYEQLEIAQVDLWYRAIAHMTDQFMKSMAESEQNEERTERILSELLSLWKLFFQRYGPHKDPLEAISSEWPSFGDDVETEGSNLAVNLRERQFGSRLQQYHPGFRSKPELQFSAITIYNHFHKDNQSAHAVSDALREENAPFLQLLTKALTGSSIEAAYMYSQRNPGFQRLPGAFRKTIVDQMHAVTARALSQTGVGAAATPEEKAHQLQEFFLKRIARSVLDQANASRLERLWSEAVKTYKVDGKPAIPPTVYNAFISGYMTLFQPDLTVKVWNHMVAHGVQPDIKTWNSMLSGCEKAGDITGLNAVWDRMAQAGIEPDSYSWSIRIHALTSKHEINSALAALDDMGRKWQAAEDAVKNPSALAKGSKSIKHVNNTTKPSIEVINSAISGIAGIRKGMRFETKKVQVYKILQWAGNFGIKPDARTYNALIQIHLRGNDVPTVMKLLRQMEREGLEGDLATHSMLLRAAFDNNQFDSLSHPEQADRVIELFTQLEQGGLKLNKYIYQISIDRCLKNFGNFDAVRVILDHMSERGLQPSPGIYTSLVGHYFQQSPPDIAAVDSLVTRIFGPPAAATDKFLFDRLIEGYALNGELGATMTVLTKMSKHGKLPSFKALTEVLKALVDAGDWERARQIVRDVQKEEGIAHGGLTGGNYGRNQFFHMVEVLGGDLTESLAGEHMKAPVKENAEQPLQQ